MEHQSKISKAMHIAACVPVIGLPFYGVNYLRTRGDERRYQALSDEWLRDNSRTDAAPQRSPDKHRLTYELFAQGPGAMATGYTLFAISYILSH